MQLSDTTKQHLKTSFVEDNWQKKSLFLPQAFVSNQAFDETIDINELAGLAIEEGIESRLIQQTDHEQLTFTLSDGPFTEAALTSLPESHWTLLIQAVDHYLEQFQQLKLEFDFIPNWRLDDVMISISPQGGTVGPHFDQYDVFLIQASGSREWQIGQHCDQHTALVPNNTLSIIDDFQQAQTYSCEVGDIVYIPPGVSHWGTATSDNCVTISIGFRAPSYQEIIDDLCLEALSKLTESQRFEDSPSSLKNNQASALIDENNISQLHQQLEKLLLDKQLITERFNAMMSQIKYDDAFNLITDDEAEVIYQNAVDNQIGHHIEMSLRADSRINYSFVGNNESAAQIIIGLNGQTFSCNVSDSLTANLQQLAQYQTIAINIVDQCPSTKALIIKALSLDAIEFFTE